MKDKDSDQDKAMTDEESNPVAEDKEVEPSTLATTESMPSEDVTVTTANTNSSNSNSNSKDGKKDNPNQPPQIDPDKNMNKNINTQQETKDETMAKNLNITVDSTTTAAAAATVANRSALSQNNTPTPVNALDADPTNDDNDSNFNDDHDNNSNTSTHSNTQSNTHDEPDLEDNNQQQTVATNQADNHHAVVHHAMDQDNNSTTDLNSTPENSHNIVEGGEGENLIVARLVSDEENNTNSNNNNKTRAKNNQKKLKKAMTIGGGVMCLLVVILVILLAALLSDRSNSDNSATVDNSNANNNNNNNITNYGNNNDGILPPSPAPVAPSQSPTVTIQPTAAPIPELTLEQTLRLQQYGNVAFYGVQFGYSLEECEDPVGEPRKLRLICRDDAEHIEILYHEAYINGATTVRHPGDIFHVGQNQTGEEPGLLQCEDQAFPFSGWENGMRLFCFPGDTNATGTLPTQFRALLLVACAKGQPGGAAEHAMDLQALVDKGAAGQNCGSFDELAGVYVGEMTMGVSIGHFCFPNNTSTEADQDNVSDNDDDAMTWNIAHPDSDPSLIKCATGGPQFVSLVDSDEGNVDPFLSCARFRRCFGTANETCGTDLNAAVWRQEEAFLDESHQCILNRGEGDHPDNLFHFNIDKMVERLKSSFSLENYGSKVHWTRKNASSV